MISRLSLLSLRAVYSSTTCSTVPITIRRMYLTLLGDLFTAGPSAIQGGFKRVAARGVLLQVIRDVGGLGRLGSRPDHSAQTGEPFTGNPNISTTGDGSARVNPAGDPFNYL